MAVSAGGDPTDNLDALPDPTCGVDTEALVARLHTLTPAQEMAILDAVERLRYTETARNRLPDEELVRVGLAYRPEDSPTGTTQPATAPQRRSQLRRRGG